MATTNFPDPNVTPEYYNPVTQEWYDWNNTSKAWRRRAGGAGGPTIPDIDDEDKQPGTLDDRYVNLTGDTMTGDLILYPSVDASPGEDGDLAIAAPDDDEIEFRYQGSDGVVRCATIDLDVCGKITNPVIAIQGKPGVLLAEYNDILETVSDGDVPGSTLDAQRWESTLDDISWSEEATTPPATLTVVQADQGKTFRLAQDFIDDSTGDLKTVHSNQIAASNDPPPITKWIAWTASGRSQISILTTNPGTVLAPLYKLNSVGGWEEVGSGIKTLSSILSAGTYLIDSSEITMINWTRSPDKGSMTFTIDASSNFDAITSMARAFDGLSKFNQDLSAWDWTNVTDWDSAFFDCAEYNQPVVGFVSSAATKTKTMFYGASSFNQPLTGWDTSNVTNMFGMFRDATSFDQSVSGLNTSNNKNFDGMFWGASSFNQDVSGFDISKGEVFDHMFEEANSFNTPISNWVFKSTASVKWIFSFNTAFNSALNWDVSNLTHFTEMFKEASVFNHSSISNWDVGNAVIMNRMFMKALKVNQDLSSWSTPNLLQMEGMFQQTPEFNGLVSGLNTSGVKSLANVFWQAKKFNKPLQNWDVSGVEDFEKFLSYSEEFNQPLNNWNTGSATNMGGMFWGAKSFNLPLNNWNTGNVTNMDKMFSSAWVFNQDLSSWCVTNISSSPPDFSGSSGFETVPNAKHPIWGTCPPTILTNPVIK